MKRYVIPFFVAAMPAHADVPNVVTDIAPVHALVSVVMEGVGTPDLIMPPGSSPHHYSMRPSEAGQLAEADLVVWVGPGLTPWLEGPVENLAGGAHHLTWLESETAVRLPFREGALFAAHDHDHEADGHEDHDGHDDHAEEGHDDHDHEAHDHKEEGHDGHDHADHDDHDHAEKEEDDHEAHDHEEEHDHDGHADHGSEESDPHVWLDPLNGQFFLGEIANELAELDPENAETYRANAKAGQVALGALSEQIDAQLAPVRGQPFIVMHDAYHYFEARFDIETLGAISASDAQTPGAARIKALRDALSGSDLACAFREPQMDPGMVAVVVEGMGANEGILDPLGADLEPGAAFYGQLIQNMADEMLRCLSE